MPRSQRGGFGELLQSSGTFLGQWTGGKLTERKLAKDLNPMRAALAESTPYVGPMANQQSRDAAAALTPQQRMVASTVHDPRQFARLAGSPAGALELGGLMAPTKPTRVRELVVHADDPLNQELGVGLKTGESATVKLNYDANDQLLPGFEIDNYRTRTENDGDGEQPSMFGTGLRGRALQYATEMSTAYAEKSLTPEDERKLYTSITELMRPEEHVDPDTGLPVRRPGAIPHFTRRALMSRPEGAQFLQYVEQSWATGVQPPLGLPNALSDPNNDPNVPPPIPNTTQTIPDESAIPPQDQGKPSLWELALSGDVTGPVASIARGAHRLPGSLLGEFPEQTEAGTYVNGIKERLIDGLRRNPRYAEGEAERLFKAIDIKPGVFDSASSMQSRVVAFDDVLQQIESEMHEVVTGRRAMVSRETRQHAMDTLQIVRNTRQILAPPRVHSDQQFSEFVRTSPPGAKFLYKENGNWELYEVEPR
jgi:hypothetical protein